MRFRFSVRDLFWLTLVVAVGLAWLVSERQLRVKLNDALETVQTYEPVYKEYVLKKEAEQAREAEIVELLDRLLRDSTKQ